MNEQDILQYLKGGEEGSTTYSNEQDILQYLKGGEEGSTTYSQIVDDLSKLRVYIKIDDYSPDQIKQITANLLIKAKINQYQYDLTGGKRKMRKMEKRSLTADENLSKTQLHQGMKQEEWYTEFGRFRETQPQMFDPILRKRKSRDESNLQIVDELSEILANTNIDDYSPEQIKQITVNLLKIAPNVERNQYVFPDLTGGERQMKIWSLTAEKVIAAVNERLKNITFPSSDVAIAQVKQRFYQIANIPNCVGAVDGTLVPIIAPKVREDLYVCRKGYHSMNAQAVVDANMRFIDVVAQWPGSTHDNTIFENCGLKRWMENRGNCWLVGDSGYALKPYLLTPKDLPVGPPSYEDAVANKVVDMNWTLLERTEETMKRVDQFGDQMTEESKERRKETENIWNTLLQHESRQEERHRVMTGFFERVSDRLEAIERTIESRHEVEDELYESNVFQYQLEMGANEDEDLGLYKCKRCRWRCQCPCSCHRRHSKRRDINNRVTGNERHRQKEFSGYIPEAHSSRMKQDAATDQLVGSCGGDPGGSSDNPFDSNDDTKKRELNRLGRQERHKGKLWKRGKISDSKSKSDQLVGACGGNPVGSSDNSSDSSDDSKKSRRKGQARLGRNTRKPNWSIDSAAWKTCIGSKNANMIDGLLREKKLPDKDLLNEACKVFELKHRRSICDEICKYIVQKASDIIYVYPATMVDQATKEIDDCSITFVVVLGEDVDLGKEFKFLIKNTNDPAPRENIKICEQEKKERVSENENDSNTVRLTKCIQNHSAVLRKKHTNVCRISHSGFKSIRFDKEGARMRQIDCITLYVYAKGFIPLGETMLPEMLDVDDCQVLVDVREGFVESYAGNQGPYDTLDHLRMGCSIGSKTPMNKEGVKRPDTKIIFGTLGGFFELGGFDFCISAAHVFLSANEMQGMQDSQQFERNDLDQGVYQPHNNYLLPFGKGRTAVYKEGEEGAPGVDVIAIKIENRNPKTGEFPNIDRGQESDKQYRGKVFTREEMRNVLKSDAYRCFYKYGCGTGWTKGKFRSECATICAPHPVQDGNTDFKICLHNQFEIYTATDKDFAGKSDSGALVFMEDGEELVAVGMVVAGMPEEVCFVTPLDEIFKAFKLDPKHGLKDFTTRVNSDPVNPEIAKLKRDLSNVDSKVASIECGITEMKTDMSGKMNDMKTDMSGKMNDMKTDMSREMNDMKTDMSGKINDMNTDMSGKMNDMKTDMSGKMNNMKTDMSREMNDMKNDMSGKMNDMNTGISGKMNDMKTDMSGKMNDMKTDINSGFAGIMSILQNKQSGNQQNSAPNS